MITSETYTEAKNTVLRECQAALGAIDTEAVNEYLDMILKADKVFFVGVGRVLLALECAGKGQGNCAGRSVAVPCEF